MLASLLLALGGTAPDLRRPETAPFERVSPSGEYVLHVALTNAFWRGPCEAVLVRDDERVWSRTLPFAPWNALVGDDGWVAAAGWPRGRKNGGCISPSAPSQNGLLALDETGRIVLDRRLSLDDGLTETTVPHAALAWVEDLVAKGEFHPWWGPAPDRGIAARGCRTLPVLGTTLLAKHWVLGETHELLVVDRGFEPVLRRTLGAGVALRSLAGGRLVVERTGEPASAFVFGRFADGPWSVAEERVVDTVERVERETWAPLARVALPGAGIGEDGEPLSIRTSCATRDGRLVVVESQTSIVRVLDGRTGTLLERIHPPAELERFRLAPAPRAAEGGAFRIQWGLAGKEERWAMLRYRLHDGGTQRVEERCLEPFQGRPYSETWYPFGSGDGLWVEARLGLRRWAEGGWKTPEVKHDAFGRELFVPSLGSSQRTVDGVGVAPDGKLAVVNSGWGLDGIQLSLYGADGEPLRTIRLPADRYPVDPLTYDGTFLYLHGSGPGHATNSLVVHDTRDDSSRLVTLEGIPLLAVCNLHYVAESNELWVVDRERHELLRFALVGR